MTYSQDIQAGSNLALVCVWQSDAAPFCENYTKLYFDAKHLEKRLNRGWWNFWCLFIQKSTLFANIGRCPSFLDLALSSFCILNHLMIYQICDVMMSISTWYRVHFWMYLLNHDSLSYQTWPIDRYKQRQ